MLTQGEEAKDDARRLLKESRDPVVLTACLNMLGEEAKDDALRLLISSDNEYVRLACIYILGEKGVDEAEKLLKSSSNRHIRKNCRKFIQKNRNTLGSLFPALAALKNPNPTDAK